MNDRTQLEYPMCLHVSMWSVPQLEMDAIYAVVPLSLDC